LTRGLRGILGRIIFGPAGLLLLLVLVNLPYLSPSFVPIHDTVQVFQGFHYFYSHFYQTGELPRWCAQGTFGTPSVFWRLVFFTPASYACMVAGRLLGVEDALLLFKASVLLEQVVFLAGLYLLCRLLYAQRASIFLVCAGAVGGMVWYSQVWWNLRIYYLVPVVLYFLIQFFERGRPGYLWLAGIAFVVSLVGNLMYYAPLWGVVFLVFALVLTCKHWRAWASLKTPAAANLLPLFVLAGLFNAYVLVLLGSFEGVEILVGCCSAGRSIPRGAATGTTRSTWVSSRWRSWSMPW